MKLTESDIKANGINLHVYRTNTDKPPLVFAHGRSDNGLCFWPIAKQFADDYEIILYDARGHGKSENPSGSTSLMDRVQDLARLIDTLGLQKPKLVGHSLGAVTVALLAGSFPDIPGSIVLEDPPPFEMLADATEQAMSRHKMWEEFIGIAKEKSIQELVEMNRKESPTWPESEREQWAQSKLQYQLKPFGEDHIQAALGEKIVSQITCPALLITADLDVGSIYPPQAADELAARLPNVKHVNIPGAGHNIRREQPAAYLNAVRDFLKNC
jgi:pimeloyl-ACP methyl ester carboxylesterase